ncbi:MAG TPA: hypothetical protein DGT23_04040 [Micromonosporaceae bacterium]|nr:hypothetical protein [Micromonosporaceae bacterium]
MDGMFLGFTLIGLALIIMGLLLVKTFRRRPCKRRPIVAFLGRLVVSAPTIAGIVVGVAALVAATASAYALRDTPVWFLPLLIVGAVIFVITRPRKPRKSATPPTPAWHVWDEELGPEHSEIERQMMHRPEPGADWAAIWPRIPNQVRRNDSTNS